MDSKLSKIKPGSGKSILPTFADPKPPQPVVPITSLLNPESDNNISNENPIANAEKIVEDALNELSGTGALQKNNRMDINSLLNPEDESIVAAEMTDEEICQAVLEVREKMLITGSDDVGDLDDVLLGARPTYHEVLLATSIINRYIDGIDSPVACQMEAVLPPFTVHTSDLIRTIEDHGVEPTSKLTLPPSL